MSTSNFSQVANFSTVLGRYDGTYLNGTVATVDPSGNIGTSDLSLNAGYLVNPNAFTTPAVGNGTGFSITCWIYPQGAQASNYTPIFDLCGNTATASNTCTLCISGNSTAPVLVGNYQGTQIYVPSGSVVANAWNFVAYTVCCSGSTQMVQTLYVNNTTMSVTGGTYSALTVANTYMGYGQGTFAQTFNGKVDDFRYYGRVVTPMEIRVLYGFAYGKTGVAALVPSLGTISATGGQVTVPFTFSNTGTYAYLNYVRVGSDGSKATGFANSSTFVPSGNGYTWSDTTANVGTTYQYVWTPWVLGAAGAAGTPVSVTTLGPASAFVLGTPTSVTASSFTLPMTGGTGTGVTYTYTVNGTSVTPTGTVAGGSLGFSGLTSPTSGQNYVWTVVIAATNAAGTTTGTATVYPLPIVSGTWNMGGNTITFTIANYIASGPTYTYSILGTGGTALTGTVTAATTTSAALTTAGTFPMVITVTMVYGAQTTVGTTTVYSNPFVINSAITGWTSGVDVSGTATSNGILYNIYAFQPNIAAAAPATTKSYTLTYSCAIGCYTYILAVGGGGGGGVGGGSGGGGGGGVVILPVYVPSTGGTNQTITVTVGGGVSGGVQFNGTPAYPYAANTTVIFNATGGYATTPSTLTAGGGGTSSNGAQMYANSAGGSVGGTYSTVSNGPGSNANFNYANTCVSSQYNSGGGGAGSVNSVGNGGNGIQCRLPGISNFNSYGGYYWGAGGGGGAYGVTNGGTGGLGGGGSGPNASNYNTTTSYAINIPTAPNGTTWGWNAGQNTGSGGGGGGGGQTGSGGCGIVMIAFPYVLIPTFTLTVTSVSAGSGFTLNFPAVSGATSYVLYVNNTLNGTALTAGSNNTITTTSTSGWFIIDVYAKNGAGTLIAEGHSNPIVYAVASFSANSGATKTTNGAYTAFTFTSSGTFTVASAGYASVLIVGGGGGGGQDNGGGGGAGGLVYFDMATKPMLLAAQAYTVTVGTGVVKTYGSVTSTPGGNSSFNGYIGYGGGSGDSNGGVSNAGGSCSGCGGYNSTGSTPTQVTYSNAFYCGGYPGGNCSAATAYVSGGGGGAAGAGGNAVAKVGGTGGAGYQCNITGSNVYYAGGGGGGCGDGFTPGAGGSGVGGAGAGRGVAPGTSNNNGAAGVGYGCGGGGGGGGGGGTGGNGSNGVVIILCASTA